MKLFSLMFVFVLGILSQIAFASSVDIASHPQGIWSVAGTEREERWIVIHNLDEAESSGIYHIEVMQRAIGAPAWQVVRLARHMAITEAALKRSILKPLSRGAVYPEPFDDALAAWQAENGGKGGDVCSSSVVECLNK